MTYYTVNFDFPIREPQNAQELAILVKLSVIFIVQYYFFMLD